MEKMWLCCETECGQMAETGSCYCTVHTPPPSPHVQYHNLSVPPSEPLLLSLPTELLYLILYSVERLQDVGSLLLSCRQFAQLLSCREKQQLMQRLTQQTVCCTMVREKHAGTAQITSHNGCIRVAYALADGRLHGPCRVYHSFTSFYYTAYKYSHSFGKQHGVYEGYMLRWGIDDTTLTFHPKLTRQLTCNYRRGVLDGEYLHESETITQRELYNNGIKLYSYTGQAGPFHRNVQQTVYEQLDDGLCRRREYINNTLVLHATLLLVLTDGLYPDSKRKRFNRYHGVHKEWTEQGRKKCVRVYARGKLLSSKIFSPSLQ